MTGFGGIILIICVSISLIIANSGAGSGVESLLAFEIGAAMIVIHLPYPVLLWSIDAFMAILFILVGFEIKLEMAEGELSSVKKASLPILAAIGGEMAPR